MFSKKYLSIVFILIFCVPLLDSIFNITPLFENAKNTENRTLAAKPQIDINSLDGFPSKYEEYYNDHFMLRNTFNKWYSDIKVKYLKQSPIPDIAFFGKDDWLFYSGFNELATYTGEENFTQDELKKYVSELERRKKFLEQHNCKMYFFIIPTKLSVYPEYLGKNIRRKKGIKTNGLLLEEYIRKHSSINIKYILPDLLEAKKEEDPILYYHTDNHWNSYGAYIGYKAIMKELGMKPLVTSELIIKDTVTKPMGIAIMMGLQDELKEVTSITKLKKDISYPGLEGNYTLPPAFSLNPNDFEMVREVKDTTKQRLVMIRDSFTNSMLPFLSQHFSRSNYIYDSWIYGLNDSIIMAEKPNIVIYEVFEPHLKAIIR